MKEARILVVDDDKMNVDVLNKMLSKTYEILTAYDGNEALSKAKIANPDLILLDIMMPDIDGFEVCNRLKDDEKTKNIPIVMVTALKEKTDRIKAIEGGADDFLNKPVDMQELHARVKSLLRIKKYHDVLMAEQERLIKFKSALDNTQESIIITNMIGDIEDVNAAFEDKFGYKLDEIKGKHISIIKHPESPLPLDKDSIFQDTKHEWNGTIICKNKFDLKFNMNIKCSPILKNGFQINLVFILS